MQIAECGDRNQKGRRMTNSLNRIDVIMANHVNRIIMKIKVQTMEGGVRLYLVRKVY